MRVSEAHKPIHLAGYTTCVGTNCPGTGAFWRSFDLCSETSQRLKNVSVKMKFNGYNWVLTPPPTSAGRAFHQGTLGDALKHCVQMYNYV
jgi:hypothetical protein